MRTETVYGLIAAAGKTKAEIASGHSMTPRMVRAVVAGSGSSPPIRSSIVEVVNQGDATVCSLVGVEARRRLTEADIWDEGDG